MNIFDLTEQYNTNEEKIDKKKESIEKLQRQLEKLQNKNSWIESIIKPIAKEISKIIEFPVSNVLGPFGLDCNVSIHFAKDIESYKDTQNRKSITFKPRFGVSPNTIRLYVKDYSINTGEFKKSTLEAVNNMNYPNVDITDLSIEELAEKWVA